MSDVKERKPIGIELEFGAFETIYSRRKKRPNVEFYLPYSDSESIAEIQLDLESDVEEYAPQLPRTVSNNRLVIDMLKELKALHLAHDKRAATAQQVDFQAETIRAAMLEQERHLQGTLFELKAYLEKFSARRRFTAYSVFFVMISTALLIGKLMWGEITLKSPFPEFAVVVSILFFFMARTLPDQRTKN